ncbi:MAG: PAC2 family protein, partial [Candidatus Hydrothermarchaeota archaeon]
MDRDIVVMEQKKVDLSNALVVVGFPTVGLVSTIAANYVVTSLGLERIGAVYSNSFPPATVVHEATPMPPVRIYASKIACGPGGNC